MKSNIFRRAKRILCFLTRPIFICKSTNFGIKKLFIKMKSDEIFYHRFRYLILAIAFCCLMSVSSNISTFNIAQVCMGSNATKHGGFFKPVDYTAKQVSIMNSATGLGLLIGCFMRVFVIILIYVSTKF